MFCRSACHIYTVLVMAYAREIATKTLWLFWGGGGGGVKDPSFLYIYIYRRGPSQDVPFFCTPSHLSELQSFKSIISTHFSLFSYLNSAWHNLVIVLYHEQQYIYIYIYGSRENQLKVFLLYIYLLFSIIYISTFISPESSRFYGSLK